MWEYVFIYLSNAFCTLICLFFVRLFIVYLRIHNPKKIIPRAGACGVKIMIVLGSGGHTFEMLQLIQNIGEEFRPRVYVIADSDEMSYSKIVSLETSISSKNKVYRHRPDVMLCNGPGTCVPICIAAFLLHVMGLKHTTVIYVESICRVQTMSLSGKILYHLADQFLVQWKQLQKNYPRAKYIGKLI